MISGRHLSGSMRLGSPSIMIAACACTRVMRTSIATRLPRQTSSSCAISWTCGDLRLDLHRAFQRARRCDGFAAQRRQAADAELVLLVPVAALELARRHRVRTGGARQPVDGADQLRRGQVQHALARPDHVRVVFELRASPSMQRQPTHQADDIGARLNEPSSLLGADQNHRRAEIEDRRLDPDVRT